LRDLPFGEVSNSPAFSISQLFASWGTVHALLNGRTIETLRVHSDVILAGFFRDTGFFGELIYTQWVTSFT